MQKLSKRQRAAAAIRAKVMGSRDFQTWWAARRHLAPLPTDPYRAYMIDKGILAPPVEHDVWKPRTNRSDLIPVDIPMNAPARKVQSLGRKHAKQHHYRQGYTPTAARPRPELTADQKEIVTLIESMAKHYNTSVPDIFFEKGASAGYYQGHGGVYGIKPFIKLNANRKNIPQQKASAAHEMGHHVHNVGAESVLGDIGANAFQTSHRIEREKTAWKIADPFMTDNRKVQKWRKKFALGTYLGTSGHGKRGVDWGFSGGVSKAILGESKPKSRRHRKGKR